MRRPSTPPLASDASPAQAPWFHARAGQFAAVAVVALFLGLAWRQLPFLSDDALISLRYAQRLAAGLGLTWTAGERSEGYSDLLWVLLQVPGAWLGVELVSWSRGLGVAGAALGVGALALSSTGRASLARALTGGLLLATTLPLAAWAVGGLEHGFLAGPLVVGLWAVARGKPRLAALCLTALVLLRADGFVLVLSLVGGLVLAAPNLAGARAAARVLVAPGVALVAQHLFRRAYHGAWVPNTAVVKVALSWARVEQGARWVGSGVTAAAVLTAVAVAALAVLPWRTPARLRWWPAATVALGWGAYLALVGGDIFPAWRQLVPSLVALAFVVAEGGEALATRLRSPRAWGLAALGMTLLCGAHVWWQGSDDENGRATTERWEWGGLPIGTLLRTTLGARAPLLAVDAAGALPYWSGLPSLDMLGLNDAWLAHHPPPGFGTGTIGHELGDGDYVLRREPDLVAFCGAVGARTPCFVGGRTLVTLPRFLREWRLVRLHHQGVDGEMYARQEGGVLGVTRTPTRVEVPALFLSSEAPTAATLSPSGGLWVRLEGEAAGRAHLRLGPGTWRAELPAELQVSWRCDGLSAQQRGHEGALHLDEEREVDLDVRAAPGASVPVERVLLTQGPPSLEPGASCGGPGARHADAQRLSWPRPEHGRWDGPGNAVFDAAGLDIDGWALEPLAAGTRLEVSVDNNDGYDFTFWRGDAALGVVSLPSAPNGGGLTVRGVALPPGALGGFDRVTVLPRGGDGAYGLGHLRLVP